MSRSIVYTRIPPCDPALVEEAKLYSVADLHEALGVEQSRHLLMSPAMRPLWPGQKIAGQAVTAQNYPGDNLLSYAALELVQPGQVLVTTNGGGLGAQCGDVASLFAQRVGAIGAIVDGPARDVEGLRDMNFPVWATSISVFHAEKRGPGSANMPITVAGVRVCPGDVIVADGDGVIAIPPALLPAALKAAQARAEREVVYRARIMAGEHVLDVVGQRETLNNAVERRDMIWRDDPTNAA